VQRNIPIAIFQENKVIFRFSVHFIKLKCAVRKNKLPKPHSVKSVFRFPTRFLTVEFNTIAKFNNRAICSKFWQFYKIWFVLDAATAVASKHGEVKGLNNILHKNVIAPTFKTNYHN